MAFLVLPPPVFLRKARATDPLTAAADAAAPAVRRWWRDLWEAFQEGLPLTWALSSLPTALRTAWQTHALPRFADLEALLQGLAQTVASAALSMLTPDVLGITQAIQAVETSLAQVPVSMAVLVPALLPDVAVLTIPQQGALVRMAEGLAQELTITPAQATRTLRTQARAQLATRTTGLSEQLTWQAVQGGQQAGWQQQAQRGELGQGVRRFWRLGSKPCVYCVTIPGANAAGVALDGLFQTPYGAVLNPPVHPHCKCSAVLGGVP